MPCSWKCGGSFSERNAATLHRCPKRPATTAAGQSWRDWALARDAFVTECPKRPAAAATPGPRRRSLRLAPPSGIEDGNNLHLRRHVPRRRRQGLDIVVVAPSLITAGGAGLLRRIDRRCRSRGQKFVCRQVSSHKTAL